MESFRDESGVFGVAGHPQAARVVAAGLEALRHRGEHAAGLVASDGLALRAWRGYGLARDVLGAAQTGGLVGRMAIGHVGRIGSAEPTVDAVPLPLPVAQPVLGRVRGGRMAVAMAGRFTNEKRIRGDLDLKGAVLSTPSDAELVLHLAAQSAQTRPVNRIVDACLQIEGAWAMLVVTEDRVVAARDPRGFRPLVLGRLDGAIAFASEDGALRAVGAEVVRDVAPGELIVVDAQGTRSVSPFPRRATSPCVQEIVAIARGDATVDGAAVQPLRAALGERLAAEQPAPRGDLVVGLPDDGLSVALGYARGAQLPFVQGLVRGPGDVAAVPSAVRGRRVVLVVPSLVTGEDVLRTVSGLARAGASEVHVRVASPAAKVGCAYGVASPTADELAALADQVALTSRLGAASLGFLSLDGLRATTSTETSRWCDACFSGDWPIPPEEPDDQLPLFRGE